MAATKITERRPGISQGSIHCPVRQMKHYIAQRNVEAIAGMLKQLRQGYGDPTRSDREKAEYLWLGRRYAEAYTEITGAPLPKEK